MAGWTVACSVAKRADRWARPKAGSSAARRDGLMAVRSVAWRADWTD